MGRERWGDGEGRRGGRPLGLSSLAAPESPLCHSLHTSRAGWKSRGERWGNSAEITSRGRSLQFAGGWGSVTGDDSQLLTLSSCSHKRRWAPCREWEGLDPGLSKCSSFSRPVRSLGGPTGFCCSIWGGVSQPGFPVLELFSSIIYL